MLSRRDGFQIMSPHTSQFQEGLSTVSVVTRNLIKGLCRDHAHRGNLASRVLSPLHCTGHSVEELGSPARMDLRVFSLDF